MRTLFVSILLIFSVTVNAQTALSGSYVSDLQEQSFAGNRYLKDGTPGKKWFVHKYMGISSSIGFFNGGNATVLAVPAGLQINRRLTDNWYAFAGVSAAPAYINFNHAFVSANTNKLGQPNNYFLRSNRFDIYSKAELGLMYTNDQKTFSISGSIGIERSSYPLVPLSQGNAVRPNVFVAPYR